MSLHAAGIVELLADERFQPFVVAVPRRYAVLKQSLRVSRLRLLGRAASDGKEDGRHNSE